MIPLSSWPLDKGGALHIVVTFDDGSADNSITPNRCWSATTFQRRPSSLQDASGNSPMARPEQYPKHEILSGIFYVLRDGCAWRLLPHDLPPWQIVYHCFWLWRKDSIWQLIHDLLRGHVRAAAGKHRQPSAGIMDSQSVKTTEKGDLRL